MNKIKEYLDECSIKYYMGEPIISDEVFDSLADSIGYARVGAKQHEDVCKHVYPMWSLQKHYEGENKQPLEGYSNLVRTPKLDGAAISLLYIDGKLTQVLTRGDGKEGRDVTNKFLSTNSLVPHEIDMHGVYQITGEIVAPKHVENSRNYAAGALNLKDITEFSTRAISFFAYGIYPYPTKTFTQDIMVLSSLGFNTVFDSEIDKIYDCDGIVCRIDDNTTFDSLGYTAQFPRGAYAVKERKEAVETELLGVEWNVGKSGKVTPTALLKPVYIGDKLVSRATLNNPDFITSLDLCIGDTVGVVLGGEIIPCITHKVSG